MDVTTLRVERNPAPVRAQVLDNLRQAIVERQLAPGQRLIERELVELTGVSRTSIREALRELAAEGLVTAIPNKGTVVARVSAEEARQLYEVRSALEGLGGRLFVQNATQAHRNALVKALQRIERLVAKGAPVINAKDSFYEILFEGGGNEALRSVAAGLRARERAARAVTVRPRPAGREPAGDAGHRTRRVGGRRGRGRSRVQPSRRGGRPGRVARPRRTERELTAVPVRLALDLLLTTG